MGAPKPPVIPQPFANDAGPDFINTIPNTTGVAGRASYDQGFPPTTMTPIFAGGEPPQGQDFNGIFFALSSHDYYVQAGQLFEWDADVAAAISGYAKGTLLGSTDGTTVWYSVVDGNMTNPDADGSTAGWVSLYSYGFAFITGLVSGVRTLTPSEARYPVIVLSGALTGNLALILPNTLQTWLIINNTSGAFTITARTAAGTGVAVPQGGFSNPLGVYGNTDNIYPTVAPLGVPISQAADGLTLVERTNTGDVYARYFNTSAQSNENPPVGSVFVENPSADGFARKATLAYFESVMALQGIGGQIQPSQIVAAAVTQFASLILASAALTGVPTAPTASSGTTTTQVASTAFVNPSSSIAVNGFRRNPDGSLDQWGSLHIGDIVAPQNGTISFPTPFAALYGVQITGSDANNTGATFALQGGSQTLLNFNWAAREIASATQDVTLQWRAIGK